MKTAEDYAHELCCHLTKCGCGLSYSQERELKHAIKETMPIEQLDALKEGMQKASKLSFYYINEDERDCVREDILIAAEQLTTKDL